jgi:hypothetical protein
MATFLHKGFVPLSHASSFREVHDIPDDLGILPITIHFFSVRSDCIIPTLSRSLSTLSHSIDLHLRIFRHSKTHRSSLKNCLVFCTENFPASYGLLEARFPFLAISI